MHDPRRENQARREIERIFRVLSERNNKQVNSSPEANVQHDSFLSELHKEIGELGNKTLSSTHEDSVEYSPCVSKVNGYLPYLTAKKKQGKASKIATELWNFFRCNHGAETGALLPRYVRKAIPFSACCWSDTAFITRESVNVIQEGISLFQELRGTCDGETNEPSQIYFAVKVTVRAHNSLNAMRSQLKCTFLSECWKASTELEYRESVLKGDASIQNLSNSKPTSIMFHISVISQATFIGYVFDYSQLGSYTFRSTQDNQQNNGDHELF